MHSNPKLPNFLIPGAAKSGTTSLYAYLKDHPDVFMPTVKEPMYFVSEQLSNINSDNPRKERVENKLVSSFEDYCTLFEDVRTEKAIGEASVYYLYYWQAAIPAIKKHLGDVQIIIGLRNPVDRAFSSYMNLVRDGHEKLSFEDSMKLEEPRDQDNWKTILHLYRKPGCYTSQVRAYLDNFSRVKVYLFDDFKADSQQVVTDCCEFLELDSSFLANTQKRHHNASLIPKNAVVDKFLFRNSAIRSSLDTLSRPFLSEERRAMWIRKIRESFSQKTTMRAETREYLKDYFREDVEELQDLIGRDLSHWV